MRHFLYPEQKCRRPSWFQLQSNYGLCACDASTVLVLYCDKDQIKLDEIESFAFSLFRGVHLISHHHSKHQSGGKTERKSLKEVPDIDVNNSLLGNASFVLIIMLSSPLYPRQKPYSNNKAYCTVCCTVQYSLLPVMLFNVCFQFIVQCSKM